MALARQNSVRQLAKLRSKCIQRGGDIGDKSDGDLRKGANISYVHEVPSKMHVDTYEEYTNPNGEGRKTAKHMNALHTYTESKQYKNMKKILSLAQFECMSILHVGKQIEFGDTKGYINKIDGQFIYIDVTGQGNIESHTQKFNIVDVTKNFKVE